MILMFRLFDKHDAVLQKHIYLSRAQLLTMQAHKHTEFTPDCAGETGSPTSKANNLGIVNSHQACCRPAASYKLFSN